MTTTESRLTRAAIIMAVVLVAVLGVLATYSVLRDDGGDTDADDSADAGADGTDDSGAGDPAATGPGRAYLGPHLDIGDRDRPYRVGCVRSAGTDDGYVVRIANLGPSTIDYRVSVDLVADGTTVGVTVDVPQLDTDEERDVPIPTEQMDGQAEDCTVAVVQTDRWLLLANA